MKFLKFASKMFAGIFLMMLLAFSICFGIMILQGYGALFVDTLPWFIMKVSVFIAGFSTLILSPLFYEKS